MNYKLLKEIHKYFPTEYESKKFNYLIRLLDIEKLQSLIDNNIYNGKLGKHTLKIELIDYDGKSSKGRFFLGKDGENYEVHISIVKHPKLDLFAQVVSVLCHELIHMYDFFYGPLKNKAINSLTGKPFLDVTDVNNRQFVNGYNVHGYYFHKQIDKFATYGIIVKETYSSNEKMKMKKIKESKLRKNIDPFFGRKMTEKLNEDDQKIKKNIEKFFNSLDNCEKDMKFYDKDHWYISFD